ncbi:MAG TPA: hypothetical protein VIC07_09935 [Acidimicrobiia bacterium]
MITDDQVIVLLAKANPMPSMDLLDSIDPVDLDHIEGTTERGSEMTNVEGERVANVEHGRRFRLTRVVGVATAALVVAIPLLRGTDRAGSPEGVAMSYISALADHDWAAVEALFDPAVAERVVDVIVARDTWDYQRAVGLTYRNVGCEQVSSGSGGSLVECEIVVETMVSRALGLEPATGSMSILAGDGGIQRVSVAMDGDNTARPHVGLIVALDEATEAFQDWIREHHPEAEDTMYDLARSGPALSPESIGLWEEYVPEFVAEMEAGG